MVDALENQVNSKVSVKIKYGDEFGSRQMSWCVRVVLNKEVMSALSSDGQGDKAGDERS
ncbi:hypothetical protein HPP92_017426 [Vanilla planifolia]|nr:hypothetical protein HPP92_017426 [Vanilla planifolia]